MIFPRLTVAALALAIMTSLVSCGESGGAPEAVRQYMPDGTVLMATFRVNELLESDFYKNLFDALPSKTKYQSFPEMMEAESGVDPTLLATVTVATTALASDDMLLIVETTRDVTRQDVEAFEPFQKREFEKRTVGEHLAYVGKKKSEFERDPGTYCIVNSRTVVLGDSKVVLSVLERGKPPVLAASMTAAMAKADFSKPMAGALDISSVDPAAIKRFTRSIPLPIFQDMKTLSADLYADAQLHVRILAACKDEKAAAELKDTIDSLLVLARKEEKEISPESLVLLDSIKLTGSGDMVTASVSVDSKVITDMLKGSRNAARKMQAVTQARGLCQGAINYAPGNKDHFPADLGEMFINSLFTAEYTISPFDSKQVPNDFGKWKPDQQRKWINENTSFFFIPNAPSDVDSTKIAVFERLHSPGLTHVAVAFRDNHAVSMTIAEADALIREQLGQSLEELSKLPRPGAGGK